MARGTGAIIKSCGNPRVFVCGHQCLFRVYLLWRRGLQGAAAARLLGTTPLEFWRLFCLAFAYGERVSAWQRIVYQTTTAFGLGRCLLGGSSSSFCPLVLWWWLLLLSSSSTSSSPVSGVSLHSLIPSASSFRTDCWLYSGKEAWETSQSLAIERTRPGTTYQVLLYRRIFPSPRRAVPKF